MTSFRRRGSLWRVGASSRRNCATNHLIFSSCGRASNSSCVAASGGGELSEWIGAGVVVTSCTDPTRAPGSRSTSPHSKLSTNTAKLPSVPTSCRIGLSPRRDRAVGWSNTRAPAGSGGSNCTGKTQRDFPSTRLASGPVRASTEGP